MDFALADKFSTMDSLFALVGQFSSSSIKLALGCAALFYIVTIIIYRIFFHELAKYPGPFLGKFTFFPKLAAMVRRDRITWQRDMLLKYGDPVRISHNELLFGTQASWVDIYGQSSKPCTKEPMFYNGFTATGSTSILNEIHRKRHSRVRRLVSHAFSQGALVRDEPNIQKRIDLFIDVVIAPAAAKGTTVNIYTKMMEHYLDIVSALCLGQSFDSVSGAAKVTHAEFDKLCVQCPKHPKGKITNC